MKKLFNLLCVVTVMLLAAITFCMCGGKYIQIQSNAAGDFIVTNTSNNESVELTGGAYIGSKNKLNAKNGDKIKIVFLPKSEYNKFKFDITFTLHDGEIVLNNSEYEYTISNSENGEYKCIFIAIYKKKDIDLKAERSLYLVIDQ